MGQPDIYWLSTFRQDLDKVPDTMDLAKDFLYILLALLFIPALNLSGMISSRMDSRISELGLRKAYGATRRCLLEQVLCENLLLRTGILIFDCIDGQRLDSDTIRQEHLRYLPFHFVHGRNVVQSCGIRYCLGRVRCAQCGVGACTCFVCVATYHHRIVELEKIKCVMIRTILHQLWNQRRQNGWIFLELLVVSFFLWTVIDPIYVLTANRAIDRGYNPEGLYVHRHVRRDERELQSRYGFRLYESGGLPSYRPHSA